MSHSALVTIYFSPKPVLGPIKNAHMLCDNMNMYSTMLLVALSDMCNGESIAIMGWLHILQPVCMIMRGVIHNASGVVCSVYMYDFNDASKLQVAHFYKCAKKKIPLLFMRLGVTTEEEFGKFVEKLSQINE